jgi:hypothetical protein
MKALVKVLKVITATTVFYVVAGKVTLAKCAKSGRFHHYQYNVKKACKLP